MLGFIQLNEMESEQCGFLTSFKGGDSEQFRLMEMGLLPGSEVRFVRCAPLGGLLDVEIRGLYLSLRVQAVTNIDVSLT